MRVMVVLLLVILQKVLGQTAQYTAANCTQEPMSCLLAEHVSCDAAADGAQQAAFAFSHWRRVGVVVGRIRVARLRRELLFLLRCVGVVGRLLLVVLAGCQALLIHLVLSVGVVASLTSWLSSWRATAKRC